MNAVDAELARILGLLPPPNAPRPASFLELLEREPRETESAEKDADA